MQNVNIENVLTTLTIPAAYSPMTLQGYLDLQDFAAIACLVFWTPCLTIVPGKEVVCKRVTREEAAARGALHLRAQRDYALEALDRMLYYYDRRGIPGNSSIVRWLLGRESTTWATLLRRDLSQ
ncbi:hypothetical protein AcV5_003438 [Taiwanofungus camphoratus]|nr:hypothetical protein AcV5_003438 [Antrodia cinnamomea]KAI0935042.1 hypothetical protein AcV7_003953 [Antrodia cinnamomea]